MPVSDRAMVYLEERRWSIYRQRKEGSNGKDGAVTNSNYRHPLVAQ